MAATLCKTGKTAKQDLGCDCGRSAASSGLWTRGIDSISFVYSTNGLEQHFRKDPHGQAGASLKELMKFNESIREFKGH